jgi:mono/diheme cytochrome c family protein
LRCGQLARAAAAILAFGACTLQGDNREPPEPEETGVRLLDLDFERMIFQDRVDPWEASRFFPDGKVMREPPEGTVPRDRVLGDPAWTSGVVGGAYVSRVPAPLSIEVLRRGQAQFEAFCAPCHGILGDGESQVAANMELRPPPSLIAPPIHGYPVGRIYQAIDQGFGLMRPYAADLSIPDRWAVVGYVQALQRARGVPVGALPPPLRARARMELP